jgi:ribosome biogenesis protein MAK21
LNQIILLKSDTEVSAKLTEIYFYTFKKFIASQGQVETRLLSAILTGLNRAYPFVTQEKRELFESHTQLLYQLVHKTTLNKATQAMMLLFQLHVSDTSDSVDRFYRVLYELMLHSDVHQTNKVSMFLNLLYRAINKDTNIPRIYAFIKRVLQVSTDA